MIRPATAEDAPAIAVLNRLPRGEAMPWLPVLHPLEDDTKFFARVVDAHRFVVSENGGAVVGFCGVDAGLVEQLYIHPDHQGQGLGSAFIAWAKHGAEALQLWTFERNHAARTFYAKHGFAEVERTDGDRNMEKTPDVRMKWTRSPTDDG